MAQPSHVNTADCTFCGTLHRRSVFRPEQLGQQSPERICLGAQGQLRVCEHLTFSYLELQRAMRGRSNPLAPLSQKFFCGDRRHRLHGDWRASGLEVLVGDTMMPPYLELQDCHIHSSYHVLCVSAELAVDPNILQAAISDLRGYICPHLSCNDQRICETYNHCMCQVIDVCETCAPLGRKCEHFHCNTKYFLWRERSQRAKLNNMDIIKLEIVRRTDDPKLPGVRLPVPDDPSWLAQLQYPFHIAWNMYERRQIFDPRSKIINDRKEDSIHIERTRDMKT